MTNDDTFGVQAYILGDKESVKSIKKEIQGIHQRKFKMASDSVYKLQLLEFLTNDDDFGI